jgi:hypothetical protein
MAYRDRVMALNPRFYWRCHEVAPGPVVDEIHPEWTEIEWPATGNTFNSQSPPLPNGEVGKSVAMTVLGGSTDGLPDGNFNVNDQSVTLMAFAKLEVECIGEGFPNIIGHSSVSPRFTFFARCLDSAGWQPGIHRAGQSCNGPTLPYGEWFHVTARCEVTEPGLANVSFYVDGVHQPDFDEIGMAWNDASSGRCSIGWSGWGEHLAGNLSEIVVVGEALTDTELSELLTSGFTGEAEATIFPAPEPIPYRFSERDFMEMGLPASKARSIASRLNANFDAAERQLLALDPDAPENRNPSGVDN